MKISKSKRFILAVIITLLGIGLFFVSLFIPPTGQIHSSVLIAGGEVFTFAGAVIGIDALYVDKFIKFKDSLLKELKEEEQK